MHADYKRLSGPKAASLAATVAVAILVLFATLPGMLTHTAVAVGTSQLTVKSQTTANGALTGMYAALFDSAGTMVGSGYTPAAFTLNNGGTYTVKVDDYGSCYFSYWADTGSTVDQRTISISANTQITAVYNCGGGGSSVEVSSVDQNNSPVNGFYTALLNANGQLVSDGYTPKTFTTTSGTTYKLEVDNYGTCSFAKWSDGVTANPRGVTATTGALSFVADYSCGVTTTSMSTTSSSSTCSGVIVITLCSSTTSSSITTSSTTSHSTSTTTTISTTTSSSTTSSTSTTSTTTGGSTVTLAVGSKLSDGQTVTGFYTVLFQNGAVVGSGFTPASFTLVTGQTYQVEVQGYGNDYFQYWANNNWVNAPLTITATSSETLTAVMCNGACSDASTAPSPSNGVTVYVNRVQASYWANCFATVCSAGTGPGAAMYVVLEDSNGNVLQGGFANEWGLTFTGLAPGSTYYVFAENCHLCHGSTHDVLFNYWTGGTLGTAQVTTNPMKVTTGAVVEAWYSCTNGCA